MLRLRRRCRCARGDHVLCVLPPPLPPPPRPARTSDVSLQSPREHSLHFNYSHPLAPPLSVFPISIIIWHPFHIGERFTTLFRCRCQRYNNNVESDERARARAHPAGITARRTESEAGSAAGAPDTEWLIDNNTYCYFVKRTANAEENVSEAPTWLFLF